MEESAGVGGVRCPVSVESGVGGVLCRWCPVSEPPPSGRGQTIFYEEKQRVWEITCNIPVTMNVINRLFSYTRECDHTQTSLYPRLSSEGSLSVKIFSIPPPIFCPPD